MSSAPPIALSDVVYVRLVDTAVGVTLLWIGPAIAFVACVLFR